ncbi:MAG: tRNA (adenosine(37)-N6)-threonylcarbamoyltransferase complex ATPase subunit type 1 TsaE [Candidatus Omnitrophica bacterium]|nr:tRNA (adenosine(37)-N6)-threonylcarbamoyltransferase complex ATPase subunit type 1 TsaE [Candidatus Omnitrophota bacterium]
MKRVIARGEEETKKVAGRLADFLRPGDVLALVGDLGSGKTTFVKGLARGLGVKGRVVSPSYVLLREYKAKSPLYHFDLYRLGYYEEVELLGYEEYFYGNGITCIEWADKIEKLLPKSYLRIQFEFLGEKKRTIRFLAVGPPARRTGGQADRHYQELIDRI